MNNALRSGAVALMAVGMAFLAGCVSEPAPAPVMAAPAVTSEQLVGKWALVSYHRDSDRERTMKEAKGQCGNPYVIAKGPNGGVMMNLADQKEKSELVLKGGKDGVTYLGPPGEAGTADDRVVSNIDANSFTTVWVDPDNAARYGTMLFVRCGARA